MMSAAPRLRILSLPRQRNLTLRNRLSTSSVKQQQQQQPKSAAPSSVRNYQQAIPIAVLSLTVGFLAGRQSFQKEEDENLVLPDGLPRTCCEAPELTEKQKALFKTLKRIVGRVNVLDGSMETTETCQFLKGARLGRGTALYIVRPKKLKQLIEIVKETVDADCVVLVQGQNTGLTGGSVPRRQGDNRPTVLVSMKDLDTIFPIDKGERVVCLAGAGLATLQTFVQTTFPDRESHSILGSTFLNPTTAAGIALGSGGTQCRKGPAFTERALYLKVVPDKFGTSVVKVVNTLGIKELDNEEGEFDSHLRHDGVIPKLDNYVRAVKGGHDFRMRKSNDTYGKAPASDVDYKNRLCRDDNEVSRCNADTRGNDCNRSEGKVLILASVHDTFARPKISKTFWVSFDSLETAFQFRRQVCLNNANDVPVSVEYMDRDSFDVIDRSGRLLGNMIKLMGTSSTLIKDLWSVKLWIESMDFWGASTVVDKLLYIVNPIIPSILPRPLMDVGRKMDHHVAMTVGDFDGSLDRFLERLETFREKKGDNVVVYECTSKTEEASLTAFRFVAAPAFRTWCVGQGVQGFSVDYALPRNNGEAPPLSSIAPLKRMRYSHFGCNVVHEDLAYAPGVDIHSIKMQIKKTVEHECGGKLPAEHGHGTEYHAPEPTQQRWKGMDPQNVMNPGVGGLSTKYRYRE
jgi:D-lactate dehydrogenase